MYFFRKKNPDRPTNFNLKVMHFINTLAIILFLIGIIYKVVEFFFLK